VHATTTASTTTTTTSTVIATKAKFIKVGVSGNVEGEIKLNQNTLCTY